MKRITFLFAVVASLAMDAQNYPPQGDERCFDVLRANLCIGECNTTMVDQVSFTAAMENETMVVCVRETQNNLCAKYSAKVYIYVNGSLITQGLLGNSYSYQFTVQIGDQVLVYHEGYDNLSGVVCKRLGNSFVDVSSEY